MVAQILGLDILRLHAFLVAGSGAGAVVMRITAEIKRDVVEIGRAVDRLGRIAVAGFDRGAGRVFGRNELLDFLFRLAFVDVEQGIGLEGEIEFRFEFNARQLQQLDCLLELWRQRKLSLDAEL